MLTIRHARAREDWNDKNLAEKGFTLVELLVVIIILGILAAVVVIAVQGFQNNGKLQACKTEKRTVEAAAAARFSETGTWPGTAADMTSGANALLKTPTYTWTHGTNGNYTGSGTGFPSGCN